MSSRSTTAKLASGLAPVENVPASAKRVATGRTPPPRGADNTNATASPTRKPCAWAKRQPNTMPPGFASRRSTACRPKRSAM